MSLPTNPTHYQSGTLIDGRYRLLRRVGEGGMACVWLARHEGLDAPVALKLREQDGHPQAGLGPSEALITEAHITAQLRHPAVVAVFDSGHTAWGDAFLAMEYLEGRVLADVLQHEGPMPAFAAVQLLLPVVDALAYCHERGFVHRDITPANIFLARERGRTCTKLLDFGVAKPAHARSPLSELSGTPGYMAPEQIGGAAGADPRIDIWALCAVLYEVVSGRRAIEGGSCAARLNATLEQAIAPLQERGHGEAALWRILERGLRKDPNQRPQSMRALHHALAQWCNGRSVPQVRAAASQVAALQEPATSEQAAQRARAVEWRPRDGSRRAASDAAAPLTVVRRGAAARRTAPAHVSQTG